MNGGFYLSSLKKNAVKQIQNNHQACRQEKRCGAVSYIHMKKGVIMNCNYGLYPGGNRFLFSGSGTHLLKYSGWIRSLIIHRRETKSCLSKIHGKKEGKQPVFMHLGLIRIAPHGYHIMVGGANHPVNDVGPINRSNQKILRNCIIICNMINVNLGKRFGFIPASISYQHPSAPHTPPCPPPPPIKTAGRSNARLDACTAHHGGVQPPPDHYCVLPSP